MNKGIKYRIYPTEQQKKNFIKTFGCCRKIWNLMLTDKIAHYEKTGEMLKNTPAQYKRMKEYEYFYEVDSLALANVQQQLETAYKNFFNNKKVFNRPKYKSLKSSKRSYTTNNQHGTVSINNGLLRLPKIGYVKINAYREPKYNWTIKSATISQDKDGKFYAGVLYEYDEKIELKPISDNAIGLDYKSNGLFMDSEGNICGSPKYYRKSEKKIAKLQRKLSRKKFRSKNYYKMKIRISKIYRHSANQRLDFLHKKSTEIANQFDIVCVEDLNMDELSNKEFGNGKATHDNSYGLFLTLLSYKLADQGKRLVKVDKWYPSSQICYKCGKQHPEMKDLSKRNFFCDCGYGNDRDMNAALNIKREGLRLLNA